MKGLRTSLTFWFVAGTVLVLLLTLGGCTTAYPGSPQAHAGITEATIEKGADGAWRGRIITGRNNERAHLAVTMPDGTSVNFEGENIDGAAAQAQAAASNAAIMERLAESADRLIGKIPASGN